MILHELAEPEVHALFVAFGDEDQVDGHRAGDRFDRHQGVPVGELGAFGVGRAAADHHFLVRRLFHEARLERRRAPRIGLGDRHGVVLPVDRDRPRRAVVAFRVDDRVAWRAPLGDADIVDARGLAAELLEEALDHFGRLRDAFAAVRNTRLAHPLLQVLDVLVDVLVDVAVHVLQLVGNPGQVRFDRFVAGRPDPQPGFRGRSRRGSWLLRRPSRAAGREQGGEGRQRDASLHGLRHLSKLLDSGGARGSLPPEAHRHLLDLAHHPQQVAADDLLRLGIGIATPEQLRREIGIARHVFKSRRVVAERAEVRAVADVIDPRDLDDVIDMIGDLCERARLHLRHRLVQPDEVFGGGPLRVVRVLRRVLPLSFQEAGRLPGAPLRDEPGKDVDHHDAAVLSGEREDVVGHVPGMIGKRPRGGMAEDHRRLGDADGVAHGRVRHVGQIDHHPEPVHLPHDFLAERREPASRGVRGGGTGPRRVAAMGQRHVADAQLVEHAEIGQGVLDRVAALDADQRGDLALAVDPDDVGRRGRPSERRRSRHHSPDHVDLLEGDGGAALVDERRRHVGRPELAADHSLLHAGDVRVDVLERAIGIHPGQVVERPLAKHFGKVVVRVDHRHGAMKGHRAGEIRVGGLGAGGCRTDARRNHRHTHREHKRCHDSHRPDPRCGDRPILAQSGE